MELSYQYKKQSAVSVLGVDMLYNLRVSYSLIQITICTGTIIPAKSHKPMCPLFQNNKGIASASSSDILEDDCRKGVA